eukprot:15311072-Alexandrium_andersonii.AAC.1
MSRGAPSNVLRVTARYDPPACRVNGMDCGWGHCPSRAPSLTHVAWPSGWKEEVDGAVSGAALG